MKFLIKSLFLFSFVYLNSSDKLKSIIEKPNESSFKKFRKFFYLTSEEKKEKLELKNFKNDIKNNIFNIVLENKKLNNMEKSFQDNEILKRKKQNNLYLNNISLNINNEKKNIRYIGNFKNNMYNGEGEIYDENGEIPFINGNNLINGKIVINESTKLINSDEFKKYNQKFSNNSIFLSINGTIGNIAFYNSESILLAEVTHR